MPSSEKHPSTVPMWRGVKFAYLIIATCLFPIAIGGYWAYGQLVTNFLSNSHQNLSCQFYTTLYMQSNLRKKKLTDTKRGYACGLDCIPRHRHVAVYPRTNEFVCDYKRGKLIPNLWDANV